MFTPSLFTNLTSASRWHSFVLPRYQRFSWKEERQQDNKPTGGKIRRAGKCAGGQAAAGGKYGGGKVRRGSTFGYHLWPRASTRLKPRSITSVCLPGSRYEGLSTAPSHRHVRNDLPSKFTSAVNSSPAALSPRSLPTSKSNQKRVNVHCYGNEHCWLYLIDPLDGSECLVGA